MNSMIAIVPWLLLSAVPALAVPDSTFTLSASAADFARYFPSYLANGYFSSMTAPRGTEGNLAYMVAFMDYGKDDIARPAAIPGWTEIDYSTGDSAAGHFWMNQAPLNPASFKDYRQTLNLHEATLTTSYRYVDHQRSTQITVTTFVSQASPHLAASQVSLTPDFDGTVQLSFALNLWAPYQPRLPLALLSGDQMQEAVAAHNMTLAAIPPATPDRAALWYRGDTHVLKSGGDVRELTLHLDGRAERGLTMAEAAAIRLPEGVEVSGIALHESPYRLALNLDVNVLKGRTYTFTKFIAASREEWGEDAKVDLELATTARRRGFDALLEEHRAAWLELWKADITIDGDARAQTAVHSDLYYLSPRRPRIRIGRWARAGFPPATPDMRSGTAICGSSRRSCCCTPSGQNRWSCFARIRCPRRRREPARAGSRARCIPGRPTRKTAPSKPRTSPTCSASARSTSMPISPSRIGSTGSQRTIATI